MSVRSKLLSIETVISQASIDLEFVMKSLKQLLMKKKSMKK